MSILLKHKPEVNTPLLDARTNQLQHRAKPLLSICQLSTEQEQYPHQGIYLCYRGRKVCSGWSDGRRKSTKFYLFCRRTVISFCQQQKIFVAYTLQAYWFQQEQLECQYLQTGHRAAFYKSLRTSVQLLKKKLFWLPDLTRKIALTMNEILIWILHLKRGKL